MLRPWSSPPPHEGPPRCTESANASMFTNRTPSADALRLSQNDARKVARERSDDKRRRAALETAGFLSLRRGGEPARGVTSREREEAWANCATIAEVVFNRVHEREKTFPSTPTSLYAIKLRCCASDPSARCPIKVRAIPKIPAEEPSAALVLPPHLVALSRPKNNALIREKPPGGASRSGHVLPRRLITPEGARKNAVLSSARTAIRHGALEPACCGSSDGTGSGTGFAWRMGKMAGISKAVTLRDRDKNKDNEGKGQLNTPYEDTM
uniref:Uncharacterized protein n=1 Tax=Steinernema glaseri TaxID=37863 RepID=A0A1I7YVB0_9BILA